MRMERKLRCGGNEDVEQVYSKLDATAVVSVQCQQLQDGSWLKNQCVAHLQHRQTGRIIEKFTTPVLT